MSAVVPPSPPGSVSHPGQRRRGLLAAGALLVCALWVLAGCGRGESGPLGTAATPAPSPGSTTPATTAAAAAATGSATTGLAGTDSPGTDSPGTDSAGTDSDGTASDTADADPATTTSAPTLAAAPLAGHYEPRVVAEYPHDVTVFTQGLEFYDGALLESGGGWNESSLRLVDVDTGIARWRIDQAEEDLFAEGVTVVGRSALQLTWKSQTLLVTDLESAAGGGTPATERRPGSYQSEGWGLCLDDNRLVMSDGSSRLAFRDPATFAVTGTVDVTLNGAPVESLNELECVGGQVLANVWQADTIVVIDPATGTVEATIDATGLVPAGYEDSRSNVLNGIAFNPERGTLWLTGKRWPVLYEVELIPA